MNLLDIVLFFALAYGAYRGWKKGCFSSILSLVGTILVFVLAFYLKNPISHFMYHNFPFITFGGIFKGITSFNIVVYESIAYLFCLSVLSVLLKVILKITGVVDKVVNLTIILALPNKILGLVFGLVEMYIYCYIILFVLAQLPISAPYYNESTLGVGIVSKTPGLSNVTNNLNQAANRIYEICLKYDKGGNKSQGDYEALDTLLKYDIITPDSARDLHQKGKLKVNNIEELVQKYEKERD